MIKINKKDNRKIEDFDFFFLRGPPSRSGTNWVGNLLNLHPEIHITGEFNLNHVKMALNNIMRMKEYLCSNKKVVNDLQIDFEKLTKRCIFNKCISDMHDKPKVRWLGDRTPVRINPILIKGKPHILIYRDGRDLLVSLTYHHLRIDPKQSMISDSFPEMIKKRILFKKNPYYFIKNPEKLLDNEIWVKHIARRWRNQMNLNEIDLKRIKEKSDAVVHVVRYEDLHADTEVEREKMYKFLGLDPKKAMPLTSLTKPGFKKEDPTSHYRKGIVGDWKNYFTKNTCEWFKEDAGQKLIDLGYEEYLKWQGNL